MAHISADYPYMPDRNHTANYYNQHLLLFVYFRTNLIQNQTFFLRFILKLALDVIDKQK